LNYFYNPFIYLFFRIARNPSPIPDSGIIHGIGKDLLAFTAFSFPSNKADDVSHFPNRENLIKSLVNWAL